MPLHQSANSVDWADRSASLLAAVEITHSVILQPAIVFLHPQVVVFPWTACYSISFLKRKVGSQQRFSAFKCQLPNNPIIVLPMYLPPAWLLSQCDYPCNHPVPIPLMHRLSGYRQKCQFG